jgi:hypothetical protein
MRPAEPEPEPQTAPAQPGAPAAGPEEDAKNEVPAAAEEKTSPLGGFVGAIGEAPKEAAPADAETVTSQAAPPPPPPAPAAVARDDAARSEPAPAGSAAETRKRAGAPRRQASGTTLIRRANLDLAGDPQALADRVSAVASGADGRVVSRSRIGRSGAVRVTLEVPAERFEQVYAQLKGLGTVRRETRWNNDISDRLEQIEQELSDGDERGQRSSKSQLESERVDLLERTRKGTVVVTISAP